MRAALIAALLFAAACEGSSERPNIQIGNTLLKGLSVATPSVEAFLGVPYAQPPVGELRWSPPKSQTPSAPRTIDASAFANACMQGSHQTDWYHGVIEDFGGDPAVFPAPSVSEDCLYLNIWRPAQVTESPQPTIVFVHGGSHTAGWSFEPNYHGEALAAQGMVVVSVGYRLGPFGYLSHPEMPAANLALEDVIAALQWLHTHSSALGVDSTRITLMGESAGADLIAHLLAAPQAKGMFQRVIHQSAGWSASGALPQQHREELAVALQNAVGAADVEALRNTSAEEVLRASESVFADAGYGPVVDGRVLTASLASLIGSAQLRAVDLLIGSNADEWLMYLGSDEAVLEELRTLAVSSGAGEIAIPEAADAQRALLNRVISARDFHCPSMLMARQNTVAGGSSWVYYFSKVRPGEKAVSIGAYHGAELPYAFDTHDDWLPTDDSDRTLTAQVMAYWVNFARYGNPNGTGFPAWPRFNDDELVLDLGSELAVATHPAAALCRRGDSTSPTISAETSGS
ncbi:MAG: carboxylesterase family protein [Pseudomonadota bacterium]